MERGVAQPGSATVLGTVGREFESRRPDHFMKIKISPGTGKAFADVFIEYQNLLLR